MTTSEAATQRRLFTSLAGDACLITAAIYAAGMLIFGVVMTFVPGLSGPQGPTDVLGGLIAGLGNLIGFAALVVGPGIAWRLHGREFSNNMIAGVILGGLLAFILMAVGALALTGVAIGLGKLTGWEFAGLIVVAGALLAAFLVMVFRLDLDAMKDMNPEASEHLTLDRARMLATLVIAVFLVGVALVIWLRPGTEFGEAVLFALGAGAFGGIVAAFTDAWVRREERKQAETGTPIGA